MKNYSSHLIFSDSSLKDGLICINQISDGVLCLFVLDNNKRLIGTLTDGDIRRSLIRGDKLEDPIVTAMEKNFQSIFLDDVTPSQIRTYRSNGIKLLPCLDENGLIKKIYDLVAKESILPIDAVLMAGGKGERLRPLTDNTPKPLLMVGDKTIIDHNVDRLIQYGVEHINVTVNYLAEQIESHFEKERDGINIFCVREKKYLGTMGSVKFIKTFYHDTVLVMNSDLFTNVDFEDFYTHHVENEADISVAAIPYSVSVPYGILESDERIIRGLREKPTYNYKVVRFPLIGYWIDIGKPEDYKKVQELVKHIKK